MSAHLRRWIAAASHRIARRAGSEPLIAQRAVAGPVPWVIAIMTMLTVIAAAAGLALGEIASGAREELAGGASVQIAGPPAEEAARQAEAAVALLAQDGAVAMVRRLNAEERTELLEPWLGTAALAGEDGLPLPELIELRLADAPDPHNLNHLRARIAAVAPDATLTRDIAWLDPVAEAIAALQWLAIGLVILLATASAAAVLMASRSALAANRETIEIMHLLGAEDRQVAEMFRRAAAIGSALGGATGFVLAFTIVMALSESFAALGAADGGEGLLNWADWLLLALIPVGGTMLAAATARLTVLASLRRMA